MIFHFHNQPSRWGAANSRLTTDFTVFKRCYHLGGLGSLNGQSETMELIEVSKLWKEETPLLVTFAQPPTERNGNKRLIISETRKLLAFNHLFSPLLLTTTIESLGKALFNSSRENWISPESLSKWRTS